MSLTIYHNPRCSKSRQTLNILKNAGVDFAIVEYLTQPPSPERLLEIAAMLDLPLGELLRRGEPAFKQADKLPELDDGSALAAWLSKNPSVLQRPIVVDDVHRRAAVGRPPESVEELLQR